MKVALPCLLLLLLGCSGRKYAYYFDTNAESLAEVSRSKSPPLSDEIGSAETKSVSINTSESSNTTSPTVTMLLNNQSTISARARKVIRQETKSVIRHMRDKGDLPRSTLSSERNKTNPKNNGFAIAGLALVIGGWLLWWPLIIGGIIASAIGLKSEQRVLATIALVLAIIGIVILLLANQHEGFA